MKRGSWLESPWRRCRCDHVLVRLSINPLSYADGRASAVKAMVFEVSGTYLAERHVFTTIVYLSDGKKSIGYRYFA